MFLENETKNIFDKKIVKNKIPLSKKSAKNIPFPKNYKLTKNIKTLIPARQLSTVILQDNDNSNLSQKYPSEINFQIVKKNIFSSIQRNIKNKIPRCNNYKKRQISWEKSKNIKIEQIHNYKIQYLLIKEKIEKIQNQKNITLDIKNKLIQEIILKLNIILKKTNDYLEEQNQDNNINDNNNNDNDIDYNIEENKKKLKIFIDKYKKLNNRLQEINNKSYISSLNNKINEIDKEINLYERENEELLLNDNNKNELVLPNIQKINKIENDLILERQLQNKIIEYKDKIAQEISIMKKIKDNEINIKKLEEVIKELNYKNKNLLDNSKDEFFIEENNNNNDKNNTDYMNINREIFKFSKKRKVTKLNEISSKKNLNHTTSINKDSNSRIITSENQSNIEDNPYIVPFTTKRKNLSCSNISMANNDTTINNNKLIKELILKNLDIKEKEEKALINIHEQGDTSLKKYKHIKLKPNFSFTKDYHRLKDDKINLFKKLQSSAEISNIRNNDNINNKEDLIKESVVDEISNKLDGPSTPSNEKSNKYNRNKRAIEFNIEPIKKIHNENNKVNNDFDENKRDIFTFTTEQREKVLNTIMYDYL